MSDLVKRLRIYGRQATDEAADRIEALEAEIKEWRMIVENLESQIKADLALSPAPEGEAVAWQKRPVFGDIRLRVWTPVEVDPEVQDFWRTVNYEIRPLYATPHRDAGG